MKKLVLFDFDGVLIDTLGICFSINQSIYDDLSLEEYKSFFEGNIYNAVRRDGTPKKHHPEFYEIYDNKTREVVIPPVLKLVVEKLAQKYILTIVSSTYSVSIQNILKKEGIDGFFVDVLGADIATDKRIKIKTLLNKYECSPENAVMVTDTLGDIREANECSVKSIGVLWGFHDEETLEKGKPFAVIDNPAGLVPVIEKVLE